MVFEQGAGGAQGGGGGCGGRELAKGAVSSRDRVCGVGGGRRGIGGR